MKENQKTYWKGLEELGKDPEYVKYAEKEFPEYLPINLNNQTDEDREGSSRRDFLKMMGFGIAAASLAACEAPVRKSIPYVNKPDNVDPGIPNYFASTYGLYCSNLFIDPSINGTYFDSANNQQIRNQRYPVIANLQLLPAFNRLSVGSHVLVRYWL